MFGASPMSTARSCMSLVYQPGENSIMNTTKHVSTVQSSPDDAAVERIFHDWDAALAARSVEAALALYAPDATIESPLVPHLLGTDTGICRGHDELRRFIEVVFQRTPPVRRRYRTSYFTDGRRLMWEYPRATPDGDQMDFVEVMEIENGLIQHHRVYWGWLGVGVMRRDEYRR